MKKILFYTLSVILVLVSVSCNNTRSWTSTSSDRDASENAVIAVENVTTVKDFIQSGTFQMANASNPAILPGQSVTIKFNAGRGQSLMFATKYAYSNDVFFAPENPGIKLFDDNGRAITGDISSQVKLWDNGTRVNQRPGKNVKYPGTAESRNITMIDRKDAQGRTYVVPSRLMKLTLDYDEAMSEFTLTISNVSGKTANATPFSPGVWAVSNRLGDNLLNEAPFFVPGEKSTLAFTQLAEAGNNKPLSEWARINTGIVTGLSPAVVVVYNGDENPLFMVGERDRGMGLRELAQMGDVSKLRESLKDVNNVKAVYILGNEPIAPGEKVESSIVYTKGDKIAYATMFGHANDWFYSNNMPVPADTRGDITRMTSLFDCGTAVSQHPGAGNTQMLFGGSPARENGTIAVVNTAYELPAPSDIIRVTLR